MEISLAYSLQIKTFVVRRIQSVLEKTGESFAREENEEFWLLNEFYYLKVEDKNILTTKDAWLNDRIMDAAKKLICKALGKIDSYQPVLNSGKKRN